MVRLSYIFFYMIVLHTALIWLLFGMVRFFYMVGGLYLSFVNQLVFMMLNFHTICFYRIGVLYDRSFYNGVFFPVVFYITAFFKPQVPLH